MTADAAVRGSGDRSGSRPAGPRDPRDPNDPEGTRVAALVELAQRGDAEAFGQIYELYVDTVYRYVYVRVGSAALAEDITAETFLRALRRIDSFTWQGRDIAAWFVTIARNLVTDYRRSSRFKLEVTTDELLGAEQVATSAGTTVPAAGPEQVVLSRARDRRLVEAVKGLRPDQQECLVLRFFHEFSVAETAKALGRSEGAVKQLQLRAVRSLAQVLGERP
jgi:RNA polymerase sigma-70 factor (ECF subfamily)